MSGLRTPARRDHLWLYLCAALLASSFGAITLALTHLSPLQVATARCAIAALALWAWSWIRPTSLVSVQGRLWPYALGVGVLGYALPFALLAWAEQSLAPGHTAMLFCSGPIFAVLIAWGYQKDERSGASLFLGMLLCTLGIGMLSMHSGWLDRRPDPWAALAVLACALCYALAGILARKAPAASDRLTRHSLGYAALILLGLCAALQEPVHLERTSGLAALYLGLVPTALCSLIRYRQIQALGYTFVSQTGYLVPTLGALIGVLFFAEPVSHLQLLGLALSLAGLWWSRRASATHSKNAAIRSSGRGGAD